MTSPDALELEAVDAALAGRYVAPEHAELAELALLLRDDRPEPTRELGDAPRPPAAAGFPAPAAKQPRFQWLRAALAPAFVAAPDRRRRLGLAGARWAAAASDDSRRAARRRRRRRRLESAARPSASGARRTAARDALRPSRPTRPAAPARTLGRSARRRSPADRCRAPREIDDVADRIGDVTADLGGFVASLERRPARSGGTLQLRIPSDKLDTRDPAAVQARHVRERAQQPRTSPPSRSRRATA